MCAIFSVLWIQFAKWIHLQRAEFLNFSNFYYTTSSALIDFSSLQIAGLAILGVGILLKLKNNDISTFIPDKYHLDLPPLLLIIIGSIIFITAFFGCCGAIKESTCMLTTVKTCISNRVKELSFYRGFLFQFAIILLTLLIVQVAIAAYAFLQIGDTQDLKSSVKQAIQKSFNSYNESKTVQEEFNFMQSFVSWMETF